VCTFLPSSSPSCATRLTVCFVSIQSARLKKNAFPSKDKSLYARKAIEYATLAEDSVVELVHYFINYGDQDDLVMLANAISEAQVSDVIAMLAADTPRTADEVLLPVKSCIEIFLGRLVTAQK